MKLIKFPNQKITFEAFLCGTPARDYIYQDADYKKQVSDAAQMIHNADYVLIGAGAGMSTAAGAQYGGKFFEESYWGYWSKQAMPGGIDLDVTPLHKLLLSALSDKKLFVLSTNADAQFVKAGLPDEKIFCTQGDYFHIQCGRACHDKIYDAVDLFHQMDQARIDCRIPSSMVPKCPVCGGPMDMNLRKDNYFVQDDGWYEAEERFSDFLTDAINKKLVLLELGVGFNTPTIIRFPFEKLVREHDNISLIRLNLNQAIVPKSFGSRAVGINADMAESIKDIVSHIRISPSSIKP